MSNKSNKNTKNVGLKPNLQTTRYVYKVIKEHVEGK